MSKKEKEMPVCIYKREKMRRRGEWKGKRGKKNIKRERKEEGVGKSGRKVFFFSSRRRHTRSLCD